MRRLTIPAFVLLSACSHTPVLTQNPSVIMPPQRYAALFKSRTRHVDQYTGFYQTFQADVTILSTDMLEAGLDQRAHAMQWAPAAVDEERGKQRRDEAARAKFYLRFYSPDRENDDLDKPKSMWRVYLDVEGRRLEGKVRRLTEKLAQLQTLYPNQDRFSSPYEVTFDVPMTSVEHVEAKVTLTGSLGTGEFVFPPL